MLGQLFYANTAKPEEQAAKDVLRAEIAQLTAEYERKHGKVKTTPLIVAKQPAATSFNNNPINVTPKRKPRQTREPKPKKLTKLELIAERMQSMKSGKLTQAEAAKKFGVTKPTVISAAKTVGYSFKAELRNADTAVNKILAVQQPTMTAREIATTAGVDIGNVYTTMEKYGLEFVRINKTLRKDIK